MLDSLEQIDNLRANRQFKSK